MARFWVSIFVAAWLAMAFGQSDADALALQNYRRLLNEVRIANIHSNMESVCALGSRIAGSPGEARTLDLIEAEFRKLGLGNIRHENFQVTVPDLDAVGLIRGSHWQAKVLPLWPNLVRTSTCDVSGPLVYGKTGTLAELSGKTIDGAILVLEFDSGSNWRNAMKLGAKAVIFIEPELMDRSDAELKFSSVPVSAPRFYLPLHEAGPVLEAAFRGESVRLKCSQNWVVRTTYNLLADLPGRNSHLDGERIVLAAPADSMSIVPGQAPGASGAASLAALLELARVLVKDGNSRPITFAAISANALSLQGWREYAERRIEEGKPTFLHLTLDLNDGSQNMGAYGRGWFYDYRNEALDPVRNLTRTMRAHADQLAPLLGATSGRYVLLDATNDSDGRVWRNTIYGRFALGCEPLAMAGMNAVTFATAENARQKLDTPFDTINGFSFERLQKQVQVLACLMWHLARDPSDSNVLSSYKVPVEPRVPKRQSLTGGFSVVEGQVAEFDPNKSFIADIPVPDAVAVASSANKTFSGVRGPMIQKVESGKAAFRFIGIPPSSAYSYYERHFTTLSAFAMDPVSGNVRIGPTQGLLGHDYETSFRLMTSYRSLPIVVFPCAAIDLYDLSDPQELSPLYTYSLADPKADALPKYFSLSLADYDPKYTGDYEDCAVLFLEKDVKYKLFMGAAPGEWRLILTGATATGPIGEGYAAASGAFRNMALRSAIDVSAVNEFRLAKFAKYKILNPGLEELQSKARESIGQARAAEMRQDWEGLDRYSRAGWAYALRAHPMIQKTVNDVVNGVLFYLALLIPFSYFAERLLFAKRSLTTQLFFSTGIFVFAFLLLRAIHPAFEIVSNPSMIFVAFVMGTLSVLVSTFIVGKFEASLRELRALRTGLGHIDVGRMSVAMAAFNLGIANMRRRKARTFLTTLTLVVMTFIVLSFTSIVPSVSIAETPSNNVATYPGIMVRAPGLESLQPVSYRAIANEFAGKALVVRRSWFYGAEIGEGSALTVEVGERTADIRCIVGLEPGEAETTGVQRALLPGGRWIRPGDVDVALLPFSLAEKLHVGNSDVGKAQVEFGGKRLTIIGILEDGRLRGTFDLDGESILPADFSLSKKYQSESSSSSQAFRKYVRIDPETCLITPYYLVRSLGGDLRTVAAKFYDASNARPALESLMPRLRMNLYAAVPSAGGLEVKQFSVLQGSSSAGLGLVLVQMFISAVFVLNTMVASVYERKREIGIFSSIGLAPNHIAVLFFAESCVYGVLGAVIGYFLAQGVARLIIQTNLIPGLFLNFSASSAVLAAGIVLAVVLLSTIYPAKVASKLAAPAYESDIQSEPEGDRWEILLPFRVGKEDAEPLIKFFADWLSGHEEHAIGDFVTGETSWRSSDSVQLSITSTVWLAPFDLGVSQRVQIEAKPGAAPNVMELTMTLERIAGEPDNWVNLNKRFLTSIRRQFLAWRTRPKLREPAPVAP